MARSINSPGVQIIETDLSNYQDVGGGTTVFAAGFASQGPTDETILITSISEFEQVFGTPETAAERYFYHTSKEILNSPSTLLTTRLPYGSGAGEGFADQYSALLFPVLSSDGSLTLEAPTHVTLTEAEYESMLQGDVSWTSLVGGTKSSSGNTINLQAGLVIVNSSKTTINEQFEGYYITITDSTEFGPGTDFTAVTKFYSLTGNGPTGLALLPENRLSFALSAEKDQAGSNSLSEVIEGVVDFELNQNYYKDTLVLNVIKVRNSIYEPQSLTYSLVETFLGSLDENKKELAPVAGIKRSFYLENIVNNQSRNIKVFVNPNISQKTNWASLSANEPSQAVLVDNEVRSVFPNSVYQPLFLRETNKEIGSVIQKLTRALTNIETTETTLIDIVVDGGLTTIHANASGNAFDDTVFTNINDLTNASSSTVLDYRACFNVFNNFVSNTRKDCVFIADPIRQIFVNGENSKVYGLKNTTFSQNIFNPLKNLFGSVNSNYSVTYGNWVKGYDAYADKQVWLPFSGHAAAAYARTDQNNQPWFAPAGLTRGTVFNITDLAFNPNQKQRDFLYTISVNPVVFFSGDGYTIFGQKTLQNKPSAFDRVNVRRLFITLERATQSALKYFVFEPNTEFTRTRLKNTIVPIFELAKNTEGVYDYLIVCDERNNTPDIIDRNELVVDVYIKPVKAAEFILVNFIATRTGQNFQELI